MKKALIIGSSVCDVNIFVQEFPHLSGDENILYQNMTMGGCAWNVASVLRQLQLPYTLFSPIGKGIYGEFVKQNFHQHNIPILIETMQKNGCCYCIIDQHGERTFLCEHGGEYRYQSNWFSQLDMSQYQCIYICGLEIEEDQNQIIYNFLKQHSHIPLYFAPGPRLCHIPKTAMDNILSLHPILHLNQKEILEYTKQADIYQSCQYLYQKTQSPIIVTLGKEGCYFYHQHHTFTMPSPQVTVYSTNGAGDTHMGACIAYRMQGADWHVSLQKANQAAALKISQKEKC